MTSVPKRFRVIASVAFSMWALCFMLPETVSAQEMQQAPVVDASEHLNSRKLQETGIPTVGRIPRQSTSRRNRVVSVSEHHNELVV